MSSPEDLKHYTIHQWTDAQKKRHYQVILWKISGFVFFVFIVPVMAWIIAEIQSDLEYPPDPGTGNIRLWLGLTFAANALVFGKFLHWAWCQTQDLSSSDFWDAKAGNKTIGSLWVLHHKAGFTSISILCVDPKHRRYGVGSDLVRSLLRTTTQPVFVRSLPALEALYNRCGFVPVTARHLPFHLIAPSYGYNWVYLPQRSIQQQKTLH